MSTTPKPGFRLRSGFLLLVIVASILAGRLVQIQAFDHNDYAAQAAAESSRDVVLPARRGSIVDRQGNPLASSVDGMMVIADPTQTAPDAPELAQLLVKRLGVDYVTTLAALQKPGSQFAYIARRVPAVQAMKTLKAVQAADFDGITLQRDPIRIYPGGDIAANLVGFMGTDEPLAGLELTFNKLLQGTEGSATYSEVLGEKVPLGDSSVTRPVDGTNLKLTIDRDVQFYAQRILQQAVRGASGDSGVAVVLDTMTGQIIALADYPSYDASDPLDFDPDDLGTRSLSDVYEPGSVEKALTVASLLDQHLVTPQTKITVPGALPRDGRVIHDYFAHGTLRLTLAGAVAKSSNIGTVLAADAMSKKQLYGYLRKFGLGSKTNVGIRGESAGLLPKLDNWTNLVKDRIVFGQSLSVNALQMASAINAIANGGVYVSPSLIKGQVTTDDGTTVGTATTSRHRVVSARAARQMSDIMQLVLDPNEGVAPGAAIPGYLVAGKTGTAQRVGPDGTYNGTFTVSFAGFAPADKPRFTAYVVVQNPRNGGGGGSVGGPAFSKLMSYVLKHFGVPPTGGRPSKLKFYW